MFRCLLLALLGLPLAAVDATWADRHGEDAAGSWAEIDAGGVAMRFRWRTFAHGEQVWLGEAPVPAAAVTALIPGIADPRSLRWRGARRIADPLALCEAVERGRRIRCMLPRLSWLRQAFPQPVPSWPRLWTGDLVSGLVAFAPIAGTRIDDLLASRLWGPPWPAAELVEPGFPASGDAEFSEEDRYAYGIEELRQPTWVRPVDRIGRGNDGDVPLAALRRVLKAGEQAAAGEPEGAALGAILAVVGISGPGGAAPPPPAPADRPEALVASGHRDLANLVSWHVAPDASRAVTISGDGVRLWDLGRWVAMGALRRPDGRTYVVDCVVWSADGTTLFTAGGEGEGELIAWDARTKLPRWRSSFAVDQAHWTGHSVGQQQNQVSNRDLLLAEGGRLLRLVQQRGVEGAFGSWSLWFDAATGASAERQAPPWQVDGVDGFRIKRSADGFVLPHLWERRPVVAARPGEVAVCDGDTFRRWSLPDLVALPVIVLPEVDMPPHEEAMLAPTVDGVRWLFHDGRSYAWAIDAAAGTAVRWYTGEGVALSVTAPGALSVRGAAGSGLPPALTAGFTVAHGAALDQPRTRGLLFELESGALRLRAAAGGPDLASLPVVAPRIAALSFPVAGELLIDADGRSWRIDLATLAVSGSSSDVQPFYRHADSSVTCPGPDGGTWTVVDYGGWILTAADGQVQRQLPPDPRWRQGGSPVAAATAAGLFVASNGRDLVCREADGALRWWCDAGEPPECDVTLLAVSPDGRFVASVGETVALRSATDGRLLCRFAPAPGGPIPLTPDGHYAARGDPGSQVSFRWLDETWPVTEFDLQRNRPDLVAAAIGLTDGLTIASLRRAWEGRCRRLGVLPSAAGAVARLPRALIERSSLPLAVDGPRVELAVRIADAPAGSTLVVRLDEVPVPSRLGTPITASEERRCLQLVPGLNRIAVSVRLPDGREGLRDSAWVVSRAAATRPPQVHLLAVGCGRYRQAGLDLDFAAKDARDLAAALKPATAAVVLDQEATREGIAAAAARLRDAAPEDVVVVFLAGHGVLDEAGGYWFLTHDADPRAPASRALPYAAIEDLLEPVPARRRLVLLDTCHAGEVDGEGLVAVAASGTAPGVRARGLRAWKTSAAPRGFDFLDLRSGVGAAVLASSAGLEFALESAEWSNGVFTLAVLEGWARGAGDDDGDGSVRVGELAAYVGARVQALTGGAQNPALRSANRSVDAVLPR